MLFYAIFLKSAFEFFPSHYVWISFHFGNNSFRKVDILSEFENIFEKRLCFEYGAVSDKKGCVLNMEPYLMAFWIWSKIQVLVK